MITNIITAAIVGGTFLTLILIVAYKANKEFNRKY